MEPIYKALTRPAMLFGVPMVPLVVVLGAIILLAFWINLLIAILIIPAVFIMQQITKKDDMAFRLLFLKIQSFTSPTSKKFYAGRASIMANSNYTKQSKNHDYPKLSVVGLDTFPNFEKLIPFNTMIGDVVISKDYDLMVTWRVDGIAFEVEDKEIIELDKERLNMLVRQFAGENVSFYYHNCRCSIETKLEKKFPNEFLQTLNDRYYEIFNKDNLKENKLFVTAVYSPFTRIEKVNLKKSSINERIKEIKKHLKSFSRITTNIEQNLKKFGAYRQGVYEENGEKYSSQLEFYNYLIGGKFAKVRVPVAPLFSYLNGNLNEIFSAQHTLQLNYNDGTKRFVKAIELKDYPNESYTGIFNILMYSNVNYTITQSFIPLSKKEARDNLKKQQSRLISAEDDAQSQIIDINTALDELQNDIIFGTYHYSLVIYSDELERVEIAANKMAIALQDLGFLSTQANIALNATYFAQLPGNFNMRPRIHTISSRNYASFMSLHNFPRGKKDHNPWGEAITILKTPNGQPFFFNIHQTNFEKNDFGKNDVLANTFVLGKSGGGKTVLMNFLLDQMCKYNGENTFADDIPTDKKKATFFYLDKDRGALGNIMATGGRYITINSGHSTGFNPFMCENKPENVRRLKVLMKMLVTRNGEILSSMEEEQLNFAVDSVMSLFSKDDRKHGISLVFQILQENSHDTNSMKSRLKAWTQGNEFGWVFDNDRDHLDFSDPQILVYGIDGTDLLKDDEISSYVAYYILWRVIDMVDGRRFGLFIDEAWDWLKNPVVAKEVFNKEKTIRKENGFLFLGTQSVEDIASSPIGTAIIEQSETILLLSNPKAKKEDYCDSLNMSEMEYEFVKNTPPEDYLFLVKKGVDHRTIATIDLSHLGGMVKILSTAKVYADELEKINNSTNTYEELYKAMKELYKIK